MDKATINFDLEKIDIVIDALDEAIIQAMRGDQTRTFGVAKLPVGVWREKASSVCSELLVARLPLRRIE